MIFTLKWKRPQERRVISERRWCQDRRIKSLPVDEVPPFAPFLAALATDEARSVAA